MYVVVRARRVSVIFFEEMELGNLGAAVLKSGYCPDRERVVALAERLARTSEQNAQAWNQTYWREVRSGNAATGHSPRALLVAMRAKARNVDLPQAASTLRLLRYNLIANDGTDFSDGESLSFLLDCACALLGGGEDDE